MFLAYGLSLNIGNTNIVKFGSEHHHF